MRNVDPSSDASSRRALVALQRIARNVISLRRVVSQMSGIHTQQRVVYSLQTSSRRAHTASRNSAKITGHDEITSSEWKPNARRHLDGNTSVRVLIPPEPLARLNSRVLSDSGTPQSAQTPRNGRRLAFTLQLLGKAKSLRAAEPVGDVCNDGEIVARADTTTPSRLSTRLDSTASVITAPVQDAQPLGEFRASRGFVANCVSYARGSPLSIVAAVTAVGFLGFAIFYVVLFGLTRPPNEVCACMLCVVLFLHLLVESHFYMSCGL